MKLNLRAQLGFSLLELSIVLLIAGLLVAGVWQLTSSMQQQRSDQSTANEVRTVVLALQRFLIDQQAALTDKTLTPNAIPNQNDNQQLSQIIASSDPTFKNTLGGNNNSALRFFIQNYLPAGMSAKFLSNPVVYTIGVANLGNINAGGGTSGAANLRGLVLYQPSGNVSDARLSRIAALIGSQGGIIPAAATTGPNVQGVFGSWTVLSSDYGISTAKAGTSQVAAYTTTVDAQINSNLLSRLNTGNAEANTMHTDLMMEETADSPRSSAKVTGAAGYGYDLVNNVKAGNPCQTGGQLELFNSSTVAAGASFNPKRYLIDDAATRNLLILGTQGPGTQILLQCRFDGTNWTWQNALPTADTRVWSTFAFGPSIRCGLNPSTNPTIAIAARCFNTNGSHSVSLYVSADASTANQCMTNVQAAWGGDPGNIPPCIWAASYRSVGNNQQGSLYVDVPPGHSWCITNINSGYNCNVSILQPPP